MLKIVRTKNYYDYYFCFWPFAIFTNIEDRAKC